MNPIAAIESLRMMLVHLEEIEASQDIESALKRVLQNGHIRTRDMGGKHSTSEMGDTIKHAILIDEGGAHNG